MSPEKEALSRFWMELLLRSIVLVRVGMMSVGTVLLLEFCLQYVSGSEQLIFRVIVVGELVAVGGGTVADGDVLVGGGVAETAIVVPTNRNIRIYIYNPIRLMNSL